jgi:hypothetical protein
MEKLNLRTETIGNLIIETYRVVDPDKAPEVTADNYTGEPADDIARYLKEDQARYDAWMRGDWEYLGVCVDIRIKTATNWAVPSIVGRASIWGVESDSGAYLEELAKELRAEAVNDMWRTLEALKATYAAVAANGALLSV